MCTSGLQSGANCSNLWHGHHSWGGNMSRLALKQLRPDESTQRLRAFLDRHAGRRWESLTPTEQEALEAELAAIGYEVVVLPLCTIAVRKRGRSPIAFAERWPAYFPRDQIGAPRGSEAPVVRRRGRAAGRKGRKGMRAAPPFEPPIPPDESDPD